MLRLETKAVTLIVDFAILAGQRAIQEIAGVKLHAWFGSPDLHDPAGAGIVDSGPQSLCSHSSIEHKVVIVTLSELQLLIRFVDALANLSRAHKVEWRAAHAAQFTGRDGSGVGRGEATGIHK